MLVGAQCSINLPSTHFLQTPDVRLTVLLNPILVLAKSLVESAPLRIVTDCDSWGKGEVEAGLLQGHLCPKAHVFKMGLILRAGQSDVMREKNAANSMLVSTNGISSKQELDLVFSTILGGNSNS